MTERTFRDPSPSRPASSHGPYAREDVAPPVPAIPKYISDNPQSLSVQQRAAQRAASVEPTERVGSPPPRLVGGRGVSLDRGPGNYQPGKGTGKGRVGDLVNLDELERPGSRNSVNFSRPISPQASPLSPHANGERVRSPPPSKPTQLGRLPQGEADRNLNSINETSATKDPVPGRGKKKGTSQGFIEGNYPTMTSTGTTAVTSSETAPQQQPPSASSTKVFSDVEKMQKPKKKKKANSALSSQESDASEGFSNAYPSDTDSVTSERSSTNERPRNYNTRAAGLLMKQPSVVREDREAEEQEESRPTKSKTNRQVAQNGNASMTIPANTSKIITKDNQQSKAAKQTDAPQAVQRASLDVPGASRHQSLSPSRSTHFSSVPQYETVDGVKHEPPPRSVSPAKSALKYSPFRGQSPIGSVSATRRAGFAASEASDTTSNMSDDGLRSVPRKKKSVRVSFDDDSVTVGRAASPPTNTGSPIIQSPQNKSKGRSWFDLVKEKRQEGAVDSDQDSIIKPIPALPSFGSVRRNHSDELEIANHQKLGEDLPRESLGSINTSSDHAAGRILLQDAKAKAEDAGTQLSQQQSSRDPLPLEITSVEGSGYHSDEEEPIAEENNHAAGLLSAQGISDQNSNTLKSTNSAPLSEPSSREVQTEESARAVPSIALQPATPGLDNGDQEQKGWLGMPGEFPDSREKSSTADSGPHPDLDQTSPGLPSAIAELVQPGLGDVAAQSDLAFPRVGEGNSGPLKEAEPKIDNESDETGDSIYSDAAEDPDDVDGDGFGSINAIVESPVPSPVVAASGKSPPASPSVKPAASKSIKPSPLTRNESELSEPTSEEGWDRAQAYWSGLSQEKRRQLENAAMPGALDERIIPTKTMRGPDSVKKKKKKVSKKSTSLSDTDPLPMYQRQDRQNLSSPTKTSQPAAPPLKSSLRQSQVPDRDEGHLRPSMRNAPAPKSSLRNDPERRSLHILGQEPKGTLPKTRPTSAVAMIDYNKSQVSAGPGHLRASSAGIPSTSLTPILAQPKKKAPVKKTMLARNDSDSSSSFKKERPSAPTSGKYTMKRTMRPSSVQDQGSTDHASSLNARAASPAGSTARRPFSTVGPGGGGMRTSMRDSVGPRKPATRTSLRESMDSRGSKSPSRFGFGKSSKAKPAAATPGSRFSSRFGDSSDEGDSRPTRSSRFADSSDDEPASLTPVRGIPRRINEGDSTDLDDSSVENVPTPSKARLNGNKPPLDTKPEGVALATGSLRATSGDGPATALGTGLQAKKAAEKDKKKRSFFGNLGSKKRDDPSRVRKADTESAARRDTPLERSKTERMLTTGAPKDERVFGPSSPTADPVSPAVRPAIASRTSSAQNSPKSPKLQRRNTPKKLATANDISWPLSQSPSEPPGSRPRTSDGAAAGTGPGRPDIGARRTTVQGPAQPSTAPPAVGKTEKKKRFGMLRKAFGMQS